MLTGTNLSAIALPNVTLTDLSTGTVLSNSGASPLNFLFSVAGPGNHSLDITGITAATANCRFSLSVLALSTPEPSSYALLFAGLGLVGFAVRRCKAT